MKKSHFLKLSQFKNADKAQPLISTLLVTGCPPILESAALYCTSSFSGHRQKYMAGGWVTQELVRAAWAWILDSISLVWRCLQRLQEL